MVISMLVSGKMARKAGMVNCSTQMVTNSVVIGLKTKRLEMDDWIIVMEMCMMDNGIRINDQVGLPCFLIFLVIFVLPSKLCRVGKVCLQ
jgi:hypothetical protein